jgi:hypothetical protein
VSDALHVFFVAGIFGDEQTFLQGRLAPQPVQGHFEYGAIGFADADMGGQGHAFVHGFKEFAQGGGVKYCDIFLKHRSYLVPCNRRHDHRVVGDETTAQRPGIRGAETSQCGEGLAHMRKRSPIGIDECFPEIEHDYSDHDVLRCARLDRNWWTASITHGPCIRKRSLPGRYLGLLSSQLNDPDATAQPMHGP